MLPKDVRIIHLCYVAGRLVIRMDEKMRIKLNSNTKEIILNMSEGNPGAMTACIELIRSGDIESLLDCDMLGLYGSELYMLWSDCCDRDLVKMAKVLRMVRAEKITKKEFWRRVKGEGYGLSFDDLLKEGEPK